MELIYKLEFNTTNSYYKEIIQDLITKFKINAKCEQYLDYILIKFNDKKELIEDFFIYMKDKLPLSIFAGKSEIIENHNSSETQLEEFDVKLNLSLFTKDDIDNLFKHNNIDFSNDINKIKEGGISRLETRNGLKNIFLPSLKHKEDFELRNNEVRLLITNINKASEILLLTPEETSLIGTIERPLVKVKLRDEINNANLYSNTGYIYVKIADDKETLLFSNALNSVGIYYLMYVSDEIYQNALKVSSFNNSTVIENGDKGLFPKIDYFTKNKYNSVKNYFDENKGVFNSILQKHEKENKNFVGVYFSNDSKESALKIKIKEEIIDLVKIPNIKNNFLHYLDKISQNDNSAKLIIDNYKKEFPKNFEHLEFDNNSNSFKTILNHVALTLGLKNYKSINDLSENSINKDLDHFEMNCIIVNNKKYLDFREVLLNIMKLKLSSFSNEDIAFILFKSLSYFILKILKSEKEITDVILCGNLFANKVLLQNTYSLLNKNYEITLPKSYPLDY